MARPADPNARDDLLRAAEVEFTRRGVDGARVEDIARRANHSKGAFYLHFRNKQDAFAGLASRVMDQVLAMVVPPPPRVPSSEEEQVAFARGRFLEEIRMFTLVWKHRALIRMMLSGAMAGAATPMAERLVDLSRRITVERFSWMRAHGLLRADLDVEMAAIMVGGGYERMARNMVASEDPPDIQALIARLEVTVADAVATPAYAAAVRRAVEAFAAPTERAPADGPFDTP